MQIILKSTWHTVGAQWLLVIFVIRLYILRLFSYTFSSLTRCCVVAPLRVGSSSLPVLSAVQQA